MTLKNNSSTSSLISALSKDTLILKKKMSPFKFFLAMSIVFLCLIAVISFSSIRDDFATKIFEFKFFIQLFLLVTLGALSASSAYVSSIPGHDDRTIKRLLILNVILIILFSLVLIFSHDSFDVHVGFDCTKGVLMFAVMPAFVLYLIINSMATLNRVKTGIYILLTALSYGAISTQLICTNDDPVHVFIWHFLPIVLIACVGGFFGAKLIKKI